MFRGANFYFIMGLMSSRLRWEVHPLQFWILILTLGCGLALGGCSGQARSVPSPSNQTIEPVARSAPTFPATPESNLPGALVASPTDTPTQLPPPSPTPVPSATPVQPTPTPTRLACWESGGRTEIGQLSTDLLRHPLDYRVHLPPCYDEEPDRRYPVLYLIHGQSYTDDQWERLGAGREADRLAAAGEVAPFIIVMPRDRDWAPPNVDGFGEAVIEVLMPYIENNYRTLNDRQNRAIGGLSRGAGWAVHLGIHYPELFGSIGAHSLAVMNGDEMLRTHLSKIPEEIMPRFYLDIGDKDRLLFSAQWLEALLVQNNVNHEWHLFVGLHSEEYWQSHVEQYLRWYAEGW